MSKTNGKRNGNSKAPEGLAPNSVQRNELGQLLPGSVLNARGRGTSYGAMVAAEWKAMLDEPISDKDKRTKRRLLMDDTFARALKGDVACKKLIYDRIWPATLQADINVNGMSSVQVLDVFAVMASDYANQGRLPDLSRGS